MKIVKIIETMKKINPDKLLLIKVGSFYYQYGKDAYIICFALDYKLKTIENNIPFCSFPKSAINKVMAKLEKIKVSYIVIDKSQNYEVQYEQNFKKQNEYVNYYNKSKKYIKNKTKINNIYKYLINNINNEKINEKISKIEEIINEV